MIIKTVHQQICWQLFIACEMGGGAEASFLPAVWETLNATGGQQVTEITFIHSRFFFSQTVHSLFSWPAAGRGRGQRPTFSGQSLSSWRPPRRFPLCGPVCGRKAWMPRLLKRSHPWESVESAGREQRVGVKGQWTIEFKLERYFT